MSVLLLVAILAATENALLAHDVGGVKTVDHPMVDEIVLGRFQPELAFSVSGSDNPADHSRDRTGAPYGGCNSPA